MILGNDSLRVGNGVIDLKANVLSWNRKQRPLRQHSSPGCDSVGPISPENGSCAIDALVYDKANVFAAKGERMLVTAQVNYTSKQQAIPFVKTNALSKSLQNAFD